MSLKCKSVPAMSVNYVILWVIHRVKKKKKSFFHVSPKICVCACECLQFVATRNMTLSWLRLFYSNLLISKVVLTHPSFRYGAVEEILCRCLHIWWHWISLEGVLKFAVFAFCVLCLCLAFCVLCLEAVFSNIIFFSIKSLFDKEFEYIFYSIHIWKPKTYLFKPKNPFKLHQNPVTQSILKLQRETHYALSGALNANVRCYCSLGPKKTICLANEKVYIFAWNLSFSALGTCIQFS